MYMQDTFIRVSIQSEFINRHPEYNQLQNNFETHAQRASDRVYQSH